MLLRWLAWLLDFDVEGVSQNVAVDRNTGVNAVIVLIKDDCQKLAQTEHCRLILNLLQAFVPELVE